jgi:ABC-type transporter Mla subunit MlaD
MVDTDEGPASPSDPLGDALRALGAIAPADLISHGVRSIESLLKVADLAIESLTNVNLAAKRLHGLLDDLEEPLRQTLPQVATGLAALSKLNDAASTLNDLAKRFSPMAAFLQPQKASGTPDGSI